MYGVLDINMSPNQKQVLLLIFISVVISSALFGYLIKEDLSLLGLILIAFTASFIVGTGYVRFLVEPLRQRSKELELLSRQTLHELNLPVATILANTQMLLKNETNVKNIKRLRRIEQSSAVLQSLYTELDYTIKKQIHKVELEVCDLKELILQKSESYQELFPQVRFNYDLESSSVKIDTIGFIKVLDNLVQNAVKYSRPDAVVNIELKEFQLSVEDEGQGMEEEFLLNAFEHYYQEDENNSGQGLGLGLVKEYCDTYKIKIYIDSKKDQGTKITLDLNKRNVNGIK